MLPNKLNQLSNDGSESMLNKPSTSYHEKQMTVFQNKNYFGSGRKQKSVSKDSAATKRDKPKRDMIWFSGSVD